MSTSEVADDVGETTGRGILVAAGARVPGSEVTDA
jgi:hypothetical protein